jgi:hypothetical protein
MIRREPSSSNIDRKTLLVMVSRTILYAQLGASALSKYRGIRQKARIFCELWGICIGRISLISDWSIQGESTQMYLLPRLLVKDIASSRVLGRAAWTISPSL